MTLDLSGLNDLKGKRKAKAKPPWQPLSLSTLHPGTYLAADPSITAFGLVLFEVSPDQRYAVHMAEQFKTESGLVAGHEDTLWRAEVIEGLIQSWLQTWMVGHDWGHVYAVHEAPPIGNLRHSKFEYSLVTGLGFRLALRAAYQDRRSEISLLPMVRRQDHARLICGDPDAKKPVHHAALKEHFDAIRDADELITNEAKRDALSIALYAAHRER